MAVIRDIHNQMCFPKRMCTDMLGLLRGISLGNLSKIWARDRPISSSNTNCCSMDVKAVCILPQLFEKELTHASRTL